MTSSQGLNNRVLEVVNRFPGCDLEDVVAECAELSWNQTFLEIDRLSRAGLAVLKQTGFGLYTITPGTAGRKTLVDHKPTAHRTRRISS